MSVTRQDLKQLNGLTFEILIHFNMYLLSWRVYIILNLYSNLWIKNFTKL